MTDDVPLICDPVPGPPGRVVKVVTRKWNATHERWIGEAIYSERRHGRTEWPDAEFCAA